jgi:hypothetical protein
MPADIVEVVEDVVVPEAEDPPAVGFEAGGAFAVVGLVAGMLGAVDLDDDPECRTGKVDNIAGDRKLAAEGEVFEAVGADSVPEAKFASVMS